MSDIQKDDAAKPTKIKASDHDIYGVTTITSLLIPLVGIVLGAVYLSKSSKVDRKLGEHLIAVGILSCLIASILWFTLGVGRMATPITIMNSPAATSTVVPVPVTPTWDINGAYAKIAAGMTKTAVESAIGKTAANCTTSEQSGSSDKYSACTYGGGSSDGGLIIVNYKNGIVATTEKSTY
jgi:hypothetical protein